jgi:steroid 5-alpha reductase family enzyme
MSGPARQLSRGASFAVVVGAYVLAFAAAYVTAEAMGHDKPILTALVADLVATLVIWIASMVLDNGSMYDPYWSVAPPVLALYYASFATDDVPGARITLVVALVFAWAIRLTLNWVRGWPGLHHEDWRYTDLYQKAPKWLISLTGIHGFPTLQVFVGCLALWPAVARGTNDLGPLDALAALVTGGAVLLELVADEQLRAFNRTKQPGEIMTTGLWRYSRHPNYLGELSFWWGLWLFALAADPGWWWTVVGPIAMTVMFVAVSIPMLDDRSKASRPGYAEHCARTSALVPLPKRRS